jgi:hypothetical protein
VQVDDDWLTISPSAGSVTPGRPLQLTVSANPPAAAGIYQGGFRIFNSTSSITITISVTSTRK